MSHPNQRNWKCLCLLLFPLLCAHNTLAAYVVIKVLSPTKQIVITGSGTGDNFYTNTTFISDAKPAKKPVELKKEPESREIASTTETEHKEPASPNQLTSEELASLSPAIITEKREIQSTPKVKPPTAPTKTKERLKRKNYLALGFVMIPTKPNVKWRIKTTIDDETHSTTEEAKYEKKFGASAEYFFLIKNHFISLGADFRTNSKQMGVDHISIQPSTAFINFGTLIPISKAPYHDLKLFAGVGAFDSLYKNKLNSWISKNHTIGGLAQLGIGLVFKGLFFNSHKNLFFDFTVRLATDTISGTQTLLQEQSTDERVKNFREVEGNIDMRSIVTDLLVKVGVTF